QGMQMQGMQMQGMQMQGMQMQGFSLAGATMSTDALTNLHVDKGEVVADDNGVTLHGAAMIGAQLVANAYDPNTQTMTTAQYRITNVVPELSGYDPTHTGSTYLYSLDQWIPDTQTWSAACGADYDNNHVAIAVTSVFDSGGNRISVPDEFTFGCTTGVIAKC